MLIRRHKEWVNLVNANCDAKKPRSKKELLKDLETWDKTQGRSATNGPSPNASNGKELDGQAWASNHRKDFDKLIADARRGAKAAKSSETEDKSFKADDHPPEPEATGSETLPDRMVID